MRNLSRQSWIYLLLMAISPSVFAHVATEHALPLSAGLIHMFTDPVHVFSLSVFVVIGLLFMARKPLLFLRDRIINRLFRW